ncbi:MAG: hypothetical protein ACREDQ_04155 [Limisphaerales bacterium]
MNRIVVPRASSPAGQPGVPSGVPSDSETLSKPAVGTTALRTGSWKASLRQTVHDQGIPALDSIAGTA